jgi:uncharacterized membrane protein YfcA
VLGLSAIAGVEAGVRVADAMPEDVLRRLFALLMIVVAVQLVWRASGRGDEAPEARPEPTV